MTAIGERPTAGSLRTATEPWVPLRLSRVLAGIKDGTHGTYSRVGSDGRPFLSAKNVQDGSLRVGDAESMISESDYREIVGNGYPRMGDVLLTIVGTIGRAAVFDEVEPIAFQRSVCFLRFNSEQSSAFMSYMVRSTYFQDQLVDRSKSAAQAGVYLGDVVACSVYSPPREIQKRIARYLDAHTAKLDLLIGKQERLIETLAERRQAVISHAVTKGLDPNAPLKDPGVGWTASVPAAWPVVKIGTAFSVTVGKMLNANKTTIDTEMVPYLRAANIQPHGLDLSEVKRMPATAADKRVLDLRSNDVVVVEGGGGYGRSDVLRADLTGWVFQNHVLRVRPRGQNSSAFMNYLMKTINANGHIASLSNHATIPSISSDKLAAVRFGLPLPSTQVEIVEHLDRETAQIDALSGKAREMIDVLKERRQALISAAVTGKIDVRGLS